MRNKMYRSCIILPSVIAFASSMALGGSARAVESSGGYRLIDDPVVVYHHSSAGRVSFDTFVLVNRPLPRRPSGSVLAGARLNGYGLELDFGQDQESSGGFAGGGRYDSRYCYVQSTFNTIDPPRGKLKKPRQGQLVHVEVHVKGVPRPLTSGARLRSGSNATPTCRRIARTVSDAEKLVGHRVRNRANRLRVYVHRHVVGGLELGQTFKVRRLSPSAKYAYGFAYGHANKLGWVRADDLGN